MNMLRMTRKQRSADGHTSVWNDLSIAIAVVANMLMNKLESTSSYRLCEEIDIFLICTLFSEIM